MGQFAVQRVRAAYRTMSGQAASLAETVSTGIGQTMPMAGSL